MAEELALVLKSVRFQDPSKIVTFFSRTGGLRTGFARGATHRENRFGASLEPLTLSVVTGRPHGMGSLYRIHHAAIVDPFRRIHADYNLLVWSGLVVRFLLGLLPPEHPEAALFDLAVSTLSLTEQSDLPPDLLWCQFAIEALGLVGYRVPLTGCIRCKSEIGEGKMAYRSSDGTILCMRCFGHGEGPGWIVTTGAVLDWISGEQAVAPGNGPIPPDDLREALKEFLDGVIREHLPRWIPVGELDFLRN